MSYKKVQEWDDSAGLEAFQNANFCQWAKINNCQCNIPLPDPDMYIDDVDYDVFIDPELVADLDYCEQKQAAARRGLTNQQLSAKSDVLDIGNTIKPSGCKVAESSYSYGVNGKSSNAWNSASWGRNGAYGGRWRTSNSWGDACVKYSYKGNELDNAWNAGLPETSGCHGNTNNQAGRKYGRGRFDSRTMTSVFKTDHCLLNGGRKNFRGKQSRSDHNETTIYPGRRTTLQWRPKSSVPGKNQAPNDSEKLVSQ
ncbi:uncharacterized protein LOC120263982 [Dioscorea cayenensis subsp. rotundata]|uniref:Uncharacterized protein LOC120263982 n=1 Tax=Dioscorea cayennensis subsp. rotundata TaxID=55577 RepID=A0AB40BKH8_DIOCR|nr:uncharacterized protein LOC120263982 [Dioscorea cayenensis subsp. rotundata]XP_039127900.1 uncharacterized protein LOC120263982 [Dioscorea cayenensis subsp. rotundata]